MVEGHIPANTSSCLSTPCSRVVYMCCIPNRKQCSQLTSVSRWPYDRAKKWWPTTSMWGYGMKPALTRRPGKACTVVPARPCARPCLHMARGVVPRTPAPVSWAALSQPSARHWELPKSPNGSCQASLHKRCSSSPVRFRRIAPQPATSCVDQKL